jgi:hypothetical protein
MQLDHYFPAADGGVGQAALVAAVHPLRWHLAVRAHRLPRSAACHDSHRPAPQQNRIYLHAIKMRKERPNKTTIQIGHTI